MNDDSESLFHNTQKYNMTDGSLVSNLRVNHYYEYTLSSGRTYQNVTYKTDLIKKEKVSEELTCLEIETTEKSNSDDSPVLGLLSPILLIPIVRRYRSKNQ